MLVLLVYFVGGFYINSESLPVGSEWVRYLSLMYWGFQVRYKNYRAPVHTVFGCVLVLNIEAV